MQERAQAGRSDSSDVGEAIDRAAEGAADAARAAHRHPALRIAARAGFVAAGISQSLVGAIAIATALGARGDAQADQSGAFRVVDAVPGGRVLLILAVAAFAALALWYLVDAWLQPAGGEAKERWADRLKGIGRVGLYAMLGVVVLGVVTGTGGDSEQTADEASSSLIGSGWGGALLVAAGIAVIGAGCFIAWRGLSRRFREELALDELGRARGPVEVLGLLGHLAKGIAIAVIGSLLVLAVVLRDPEQASGMDGALQSVLTVPFGPWLLIALGAGLVLAGLYEIVRARYGRLD